jgi:deoxyribodipyrimidine photolyase-related protein
MAKLMATRGSVWILGDQLLEAHPALAAAESEFKPSEISVVMIESKARLERHPYHRKKLVLLLSAMRHYAARLKASGYRVDYRQTRTTLDGLRDHLLSWGPSKVFTMAASEYGGRQFQGTLSEKLGGLPVAILDNTQFLTGRFNPIPEPEPGKGYVMENFYRAMRRNFGLLMDGESPAGGIWNYDKENRKPLPRDIVPPSLPSFVPDKITEQVMVEVKGFERASGLLDGFSLGVTHEQAQAAFQDFLTRRLANFGPYEDAMSQEHHTLFHSVLSPYLNLGLLDPLELARQAEAVYRKGVAPINSVEGFIRQIVGWREYIYWQYHRMMPEYLQYNFWGASRPIPEFFWNGETDMNCLQSVFKCIQRAGYAHHIERLMLISNFALLTKLMPLEVNEWFLCSFIDAFEWVMAPNVIGMGLHADGGLTATKPYIASANYISKMSDYCRSCMYDHKKRNGADACPFNTLYWNFLIEHEDLLRNNPRMGRNVLGLRYLEDEERNRVRAEAAVFLKTLENSP